MLKKKKKTWDWRAYTQTRGEGMAATIQTNRETETTERDDERPSIDWILNTTILIIVHLCKSSEIRYN